MSGLIDLLTRTGWWFPFSFATCVVVMVGIRLVWWRKKLWMKVVLCVLSVVWVAILVAAAVNVDLDRVPI